MAGLTSLIIPVLIFLIVLSLLYWLIITFAPEPFQKYAIAVVIVIAVLVLIKFLAGFA